MKRLFLDANILFSAAYSSEGKSALIVELAAIGIWQIFTSAFTIEEAHRNLDAKYPEMILQFNDLLKKITIVAEFSGLHFPAGLTEKDRPVFQAAYGCKATHLITGDIVHFGKYMQKPAETFGILVMTPSQFLDKRLGDVVTYVA